jgi:hypothetical protein
MECYQQDSNSFELFGFEIILKKKHNKKSVQK